MRGDLWRFDLTAETWEKLGGPETFEEHMAELFPAPAPVANSTANDTACANCTVDEEDDLLVEGEDEAAAATDASTEQDEENTTNSTTPAAPVDLKTLHPAPRFLPVMELVGGDLVITTGQGWHAKGLNKEGSKRLYNDVWRFDLAENEFTLIAPGTCGL